MSTPLNGSTSLHSGDLLDATGLVATPPTVIMFTPTLATVQSYSTSAAVQSYSTSASPYYGLAVVPGTGA